MRRELIGAALGLSASILLTSVVLAAQAPTTEDFAKTVAISDMFEIQSGQLASEKAQNGDVRSFGKQMVADHTKTSDQLKNLIDDKDIKVELPGKLDAEHQTNLDKLNGLSGAQFDKEFVRMQIDAHQKAIALFEGYAAAGENNDLNKECLLTAQRLPRLTLVSCWCSMCCRRRRLGSACSTREPFRSSNEGTETGFAQRVPRRVRLVRSNVGRALLFLLGANLASPPTFTPMEGPAPEWKEK